jgi:P2-related tail formation protein
VDVDILIAYSSKVASKSLLFWLADEHHIDSWGGTINLTITAGIKSLPAN